MDIRLKTVPYEYCGHKLNLCCNMNVLADLQEEGSLDALLDGTKSLRSFNMLMAAMINDAADADGVDLHVTHREFGRTSGWKDFAKLRSDIFGLLISAVADPDDGVESADETKNAQTSEDAATA